MRTALQNNKNAQKGSERKSVILNIRVTKSEKKKWQAIAEREGMTLSCWVEKNLNAYCDQKVFR